MVPERLPRILHLITGLDTGGAERSLANLLLGVTGRRQVPYVVSLSGVGHYGPVFAREGIGFDALGLALTPRSLAATWRIRQIVRRFRPDAIQGWMYHGNLIASLTPQLARCQIPVVWNIRQSLYDIGTEKPGTRRVIRLLASISRRPRTIIYNSHEARAHHEAFGFAAARGIVIPNGFDAERWRPDAEHRRKLREELRLTEDDLLLGFVGRHHPMKDVPTFLKACAEALADNERLHVVLIGERLSLDNPDLTPYFAQLPPGRVHVLGCRNDVERIMPAFDLFCLSSTSEAFPNVLGEAMATALPCVATDVGDCARLLDGHGSLVPAGNPARMADAITSFARAPLARRREIGQAARARIVAAYSLDATVEAYAELYDSLVKRDV